MTIIEAMQDPAVFGRHFSDLASWRAWIVWLKALYGLPLDAAELATFQKHTRRTTPRPGGYQTGVLIAGRQSGKSRITALVAAYEALGAGRGLVVPVIAQDRVAGQRVLLGYIRELLDDLGAVERDTVEAVELPSGALVGVYTCGRSPIRGIRAPLVALDEVAHFRASDGGEAVDESTVRAAIPTTATTRGKLLMLSSPWVKRGVLWDYFQRYYLAEQAEPQPSVLVWQATAPEMNPALLSNPDYVAAQLADPTAAQTEWLGEFRDSDGALVTFEQVAACVDRGTFERAPEADGLRRFAHFDAGGTASKDRAALAIGAEVAPGRLRVDLVRTWRNRNPEATITEAAELVRSHGLHAVQIDRAASAYVAQFFDRAAIKAAVWEGDTSKALANLGGGIKAGAVRLLDSPDLVRELTSLETKAMPGGTLRVDAPRTGAGHGDRAVAVAGLYLMVAQRPGRAYNPTAGIGPTLVRESGPTAPPRGYKRTSDPDVFIPEDMEDL